MEQGGTLPPGPQEGLLHLLRQRQCGGGGGGGGQHPLRAARIPCTLSAPQGQKQILLTLKNCVKNLCN